MSERSFNDLARALATRMPRRQTVGALTPAPPRGDERFDAIARALATPMPRRQALRLITAAVAGAATPALWPRQAAARPGQRRRSGLECDFDPSAVRSIFNHGPLCGPPGRDWRCVDGAHCCSDGGDLGREGYYCCADACECFKGACCDPRSSRGVDPDGTPNCCAVGWTWCSSHACCNAGTNGGLCVDGQCRAKCPSGRKQCGTTCCKKGEVCTKDKKCCPAAPVAAKALSPLTPVRGGTVTLDGSKSTGKIVSYKWKLSLGSDCPAGVSLAETTLTGARQSFRALCSVKATLTVSDGCKSSSATTTAKVKPRVWKTPFKHVGEARLDSLLVDGFLSLGRNVCSLDGLTGEQTSGHLLHRGDDAGPERSGFTVTEIDDGPFKGNWYVGKYAALVSRSSLISKDLFPGSDLYEANRAAGLLGDFGALAGSVRTHERLHSTLIGEALAAADPAKALESMAGQSETEVGDDANVALVKTEDALAQATADAKVKARMPQTWRRAATVLVRVSGGGFTKLTFPSLAALGDE